MRLLFPHGTVFEAWATIAAQLHEYSTGGHQLDDRIETIAADALAEC
ncbi:hypothetical protein [Ornithinimicrobium cavernae]|nr:hypothetical protein [Ornithinimicrobium cavernae]